MVKISQIIYLVSSWLFLVGVTVLVFLAGMVVVALQMSWNYHITLGIFLGALLLVMLASQYPGRFPRKIKGLTWILFGVYLFQAFGTIYLRAQAPVVSAFHPVLALVEFSLGLALARAAWPLVRQNQAPSPVLSGSGVSIQPEG
jgi:hypothetical protein